MKDLNNLSHLDLCSKLYEVSVEYRELQEEYINRFEKVASYVNEMPSAYDGADLDRLMSPFYEVEKHEALKIKLQKADLTDTEWGMLKNVSFK